MPGCGHCGELWFHGWNCPLGNGMPVVPTGQVTYFVLYQKQCPSCLWTDSHAKWCRTQKKPPLSMEED
jgi:hypothetical protein